eukprot:TRINITY_DN3848_c0_g1_i1.p2 TRINITY_DN3848_c0_g1~~TRINITY_DN3848_c0_g1_i1.p2  ORF type:complete len:108 (-),score=20.48 TRINITY_DN3848_c0_g1_i1:104-427(-)
MSKEFGREELKGYTGKNGKSILISVKGVIFDVSASRTFYGEGGSYHPLAGREASVALARTSLEKDDLECENWAALNIEEKAVLEQWFQRFRTKYPIVGQYKPSPSKL